MAAIPDDLRLSDGEVVLRTHVPADVDWVTETLQGADDITRWTRIPHPYGRTDAEEWIATSASGRAAGTECSLVVCTADGTPVGAVGLHRIGVVADPASTFLPDEVGYWLAPAARGRGVMTRAVRLLVDWAFAELGRPWVTLATLDGNHASRRVAERAGFTFVGSFTPVPDPTDPCATGVALHRYVRRP